MTTGGAAWERRRIGLASASALAVGNMIGAGVFTTSGLALADLGAPRSQTAWPVQTLSANLRLSACAGTPMGFCQD